jgi:non-ribosomal peptide synthetase component F
MSEAERISSLSPAKRDLLLRKLQERRGTASLPGPAAPVLVPDPEGLCEPFPLSPIQQAYWAGRSGLFDLGTLGANGYFELHFLRFPPPLLERLETAFRRLIERHPMLRMVVLPDGMQRILESVPPFVFATVDLRQQGAETVAARLLASRQELRARKAPIDRWPLFDFVTFLLDRDEMRLQIRFELLLLDGVARLFLFRELFELFRDPDRELPPLECNYRVFIRTWMDFRGSERFRRARAFWLDRLDRLPPAPELPLACNVGPEIPSLFANLPVQALEPEAWARLKNHASRLGLTPTAVVLTAFTEVLAAWSRKPAFTLPVLGTFNPPIHPQIDRVVGNFNSLTLIPVADQEGDFGARAQRLHRRVAASLDHAYFSGFEVLRESNRRRGGTSKTAIPVLFDSLVELRHRRYTYLEAGDLGHGVQARYVDHAGMYVPQFLLMAMVAEMDGGLHTRWQFVEPVFPAGLIEQMADAYRRRLQDLAGDEESWRASWSETMRRLPPAQQLARRAVAGGEIAQAAADETLLTAFRLRAAERPHATAVAVDDRRLTYGELAARADGLAARLRESGVGAGSAVGIVLDRGAKQVIASLAALQAGGACLVFEPPPAGGSLPLLLRRCAAIVSDDGLETLPWPAGVPRLSVAADSDPAVDAAGVEPGPLAEDLACLIPDPAATASSCFAFDHRAALASVREIASRLGLRPGDGVFNGSPLSSAPGLLGTFGALGEGATLLLPGARQLAPGGLADLAGKHRPTAWISPPAVLEGLVADLDGRPGDGLRRLRCALLVGDPVPVRLPARLKRLAADSRVEVLSMAAGTLGAVCQTVEEAGEGWLGLGGGRPLARQSVHVLNPLLAPCPDWVIGEIHLGGAGLARGVWGETDESGSPFGVDPRTGERLLRTGLLGRHLPDGRSDWIGGEDAVAEVLGYRFLLREVEAALERHPAVRGALLRSRPHPQNRLRPWAYVIAGQSPPAKAELVEILGSSLPYYMIPSGFTFLEDWPLAPDGSVNRDVLPEPRDEPPPVPANDAVERWLARAFGDLLGRGPVEADQDFFALGGDSLSLTRLASRVRERFGGELPLWEMFCEPTVRHLSEVIRRATAAPSS